MNQCVTLINNITTIDKNILPRFQTAPQIKATANSSQKIDMPTDIAYLDTASSHILLHPAQRYVTDTPHKKLSVKFANGTHAESIGSGTIAPGPVTIPVSIMRKSNLVTQLLGVAPFTQAGCEAHLTNTATTITNDGAFVLSASKSPAEQLWKIDLAQLPLPAVANLAIRMQSIQERVNYFQCLLGNRPISTITKALQRNYIRTVEGWPAVTASQFTTHAKNVPAIAIGHLQEHRKNVGSTRKRHTLTPLVDSAPPDTDPDEINQELPHIWIRRIDNSVHADAKTLQKYNSDGRYLMHFVFNNYHHVEICSSLDGADTADAYRKGLEFFESKGHLVDFIRIDNTTSPHLRLLLFRRTFANKPLKLEYVNVGDHRRNKAEKSIQLIERAYLSTIASMDASFPSTRRLTILPQLEITVNHLVGWSPNQLVSAYHGLHGHRYDFNAHPFTIAGCRVSRHVD